ncbi:MAG TPA: hypothetical protein PK511_06265 [Chitinophagales bacterium]|nr:hypothetical protein [Chitinophagales bacterium]HMX04857.1 hypothetical protein [Chitinophagales bacterium]HMZ89850.1 hypothetical protein [Chitinophagales bacterium]HNA58318.1 hypothetical protein [Chitinophagales bacterium]HNE44657.1 hypothetical protein [Chitinophagales bacterium]
MKDTLPQENPYQLDFIGRLKGMLPAHISLADQLIDILNISQDSAYRRIRGETAMSIDEAITLCNHYKIPIAYFTDEIKGLVNFRYVAPDGTKASFIKHIEMIYKSSDELLNHEDRRIQYSAIDTPLFLQFAFEPLAKFKMHFWMREIEGIDDFKPHYDPNDIDRELVTLANKIHDVYLMIPSDEIWPDDIMHTTLKQLHYYHEADYFKKKEDLEEIIAQLNHLIDHTEAMASISRKLKYGDRLKQPYQEFNLYQSDVLLGNNTVLTFGGGKTTSYISHMTFSILSTNSARYASETEAWMKSILNKSNLISGISEKNRSKYFRHLRKVVEIAREKMLA